MWQRVCIAIVALALTAPPALAGNGFQFVDWTESGSGVVNGTLLGAPVTLTGATGTNVYGGSWQGFDADFFAPRLATTDVVELQGLNGHSFTLSFGAPVSDPVIHLASLASTIQLPQGTVVAKLSGQETLVVSGSTISGALKNADQQGFTDSNGTVRLTGSFSSLTFSVTPTFLDGNTVDGVPIQVGVAVTGPQTEIALTPPDPRPDGSYAGTVGVHVAAIDNSASGFVETRCVLDPPAAPADFDSLPAGCPFLSGGGVDVPGEHTVYAASRDWYGTKEAPVSRSFRIAPAPDTTITDGPSGTIWEPAPQFSFSATIAGSTFECRLDGGVFAACTAPHRTPALTAGAHSFEVRAIAGGIVDPTPAARAFTVGAPLTKQLSCQVKPVYWGSMTLDFSHPDKYACEIRSADVGTNGCGAPHPCTWDNRSCPAANNCVWTNQLCPSGARCTLTTRLHWYDADLHFNWGAIASAALGPQCAFGGGRSVCTWAPHPHSEAMCTTGFDGDRCYTSTTIVALGDGSPLWAGCETALVLGAGQIGVSRFRYDDVRRIECDADLKIEPAAPLAAVPTTEGAVFYAPAAGTIRLQPTILRVVRAAAAKAGPRVVRAAAAKAGPRIAPARVTVTQAGPVKIPLKLNPAAKRLLNRKKRLAVNVKATFTQAGAPPLTNTTRVTLTRPKALPRLCRPAKNAKRRPNCLSSRSRS
jgi:hypothetical protein